MAARCSAPAAPRTRSASGPTSRPSASASGTTLPRRRSGSRRTARSPRSWCGRKSSSSPPTYRRPRPRRSARSSPGWRRGRSAAAARSWSRCARPGLPRPEGSSRRLVWRLAAAGRTVSAMRFATRSAPFALVAVLTLAAGIAQAADPVSLAPRGEPGEPFEVSGVVYENDGKTPATGVRVLVYHTDATGHYSKGGQDREHARLSGTAVTGKDGVYRFRSIWPGPYPGGGVPRHVHYELTAADGRRMSAELEFSNDPLLAAREREAAQAAAKRGDRLHSVQTAAKGKDGVRRSTFDLRLPARSGRAS